MPKWSDVFGNHKVSASNGGSNSLVKERPLELLRRALRNYLRSVVFRAPLGGRVAMPLKNAVALVCSCCRSGKAQPKFEGVFWTKSKKKLNWVLRACSQTADGAKA